MSKSTVTLVFPSLEHLGTFTRFVESPYWADTATLTASIPRLDAIITRAMNDFSAELLLENDTIMLCGDPATVVMRLK